MSLAAVLAFAIPVAATAVEWDQKQVAALADQLTRDVAKIKDGIARDWEQSDKHSARYVVLDDLMTLQHRVVALQTLLGAGEGREQSAPVYRRVLILVSQARQDAAAFPEVAAQKQHIEAAHKTLAKLSAYYAPVPVLLPPPPEPQPPDAPEASLPPPEAERAR
jgi:negative regulator of replication initiation